MKTQVPFSVAPSCHVEVNSPFSAIPADQLAGVCGGVGIGIDISQMPDRSETCGTMWILDQLLRRFTPRLF